MIDQNTDLSQDEAPSRHVSISRVNHELLDSQSMDRHEQSIQLRKYAACTAIVVACILVFFSVLFFGQMMTDNNLNVAFIPYAIGFMLSMLIAGVTTIILLVKSTFTNTTREDMGMIQNIPSVSVIADLLKAAKEFFTKK